MKNEKNLSCLKVFKFRVSQPRPIFGVEGEPAAGKKSGTDAPAAAPIDAAKRKSTLDSIRAAEERDRAKENAGSNKEAVAEKPTFKSEVVSFSPETAKKIKERVGLGSDGLLAGVPPAIAEKLGISDAEDIQVTSDGQTVLLADRQIKAVTSTPNGALTKLGLSKGIRTAVGLHDHRETGEDGGDVVSYTVVTINDKKTLWLKVGQ